MLDQTADLANRPVLVIEDSPTQLALLQTMLEDAGYAVRSAESCSNVGLLLDSELPAIILCDIMLPGMDGLEFCRTIRRSENDQIRRLPFILVTSIDNPEGIVRGLAAGANDYVTKPVNRDVLLARMRTHLHLAQMRQEIEIANEQLSARNREMEQNLEQARVQQHSLLPERIPEMAGLDVAVRFEPHDKIGGDFYDLVRLDDHRLLVFLSDVSGHGISGALFTATVKAFLNRALTETANPAAILNDMNLAMCHSALERFFLTAVCAVIDTEKKTVTYANAGHPSGILRRRNRDCLVLESQSMPLNVSQDNRFMEDQKPLEAGDVLVFYTDGVTESTNSATELYGEEALFGALQDVGDNDDSEAVVRTVLADIDRFTDNHPIDDDLLIVAIRNAT